MCPAGCDDKPACFESGWWAQRRCVFVQLGCVQRAVCTSSVCVVQSLNARYAKQLSAFEETQVQLKVRKSVLAHSCCPLPCWLARVQRAHAHSSQKLTHTRTHTPPQPRPLCGGTPALPAFCRVTCERVMLAAGVHRTHASRALVRSCRIKPGKRSAISAHSISACLQLCRAPSA